MKQIKGKKGQIGVIIFFVLIALISLSVIAFNLLKEKQCNEAYKLDYGFDNGKCSIQIGACFCEQKVCKEKSCETDISSIRVFDLK